MLVSVIIRTKNEEKWLKSCLTAVYAQSHKDIEVIIIDNLSSDKTIEVAKAFQVNKICMIEKYNPSKALNIGIEEAKGEVCVFLSAHCVPTNNKWLENLIKPFVETGATCSYGRQIPTSLSNADNARDLLMTFGKEAVHQKSDFKFHNANSAILRKILNKYPFDENLTNLEDWHWALGAISRGEMIFYEPSSVVFHHHGLHQHEDESSSFRAEPVSKLLINAYKLEKHDEPFFDYKNWDGLTICSKASARILSQVIDKFPTNYFILNACTGDAFDSDSVIKMESASEADFYNFLQDALFLAEKKFRKVFDYIIFADFDYPNLDPKLATLNAKNLFESWGELASAGRLITGKQLDLKNAGSVSASDLFPTKANQANQIELTIGQCGALRSTVLREGRPHKLKYIITNILSREEALKVS